MLLVGRTAVLDESSRVRARLETELRVVSSVEQALGGAISALTHDVLHPHLAPPPQMDPTAADGPASGPDGPAAVPDRSALISHNIFSNSLLKSTTPQNRQLDILAMLNNQVEQ